MFFAYGITSYIVCEPFQCCAQHPVESQVTLNRPQEKNSLGGPLINALGDLDHRLSARIVQYCMDTLRTPSRDHLTLTIEKTK